jgi:hypothetical protein
MYKHRMNESKTLKIILELQNFDAEIWPIFLKSFEFI